MDLLLILSQEHDKLPLAELRAVLEIEEIETEMEIVCPGLVILRNLGEDVFDDNGTTSIDKVEIVAGEDSQEIYNISGQLVSTNGTFAGLPKGIYVKGGKKFIVK